MIYVNARAIIQRVSNNEEQVLVQIRDKPGEKNWYELPGGQIEPFEPLLEALKREVREETGLEIVSITGEEKRVVTSNEGGFTVECLKPFACYQTLRGPVDSLGLYFLCEAQGNLTREGDFAKEAKWINKNDLMKLIMSDGQFSDIDKAGVQF